MKFSSWSHVVSVLIWAAIITIFIAANTWIVLDALSYYNLLD